MILFRYRENNMKINERIKKRRIELGMSLEDVAKIVGVNKSTIYKYENGISEKLPTQVLTQLSVALRCSPTYLLGLEDELVYSKSGLDFIRVPLYGPICCGNGGFNEDNVIEYIPVPSSGLISNKEYFCQYAVGDSMLEKIEDGDLLVFEKNSAPELNTICCFCTEENTSMCKMFVKSGSVYMLKPLNSNYDSIVVDSDSFRCIGKLKKIIRSV